MNTPFASHAGRFKKVLCFLAVGFVVSLNVAKATNYSWAFNIDDFWDDNTAWNPQGVPGMADNVWITNAGIYTVYLDEDEAVNNLMLGNAGMPGSQVLNTGENNFTIGSAPTNGAAAMTINSGGGIVVGDGSGNGSLQVLSQYPSVSGGLLSVAGPVSVQGNLTLLPTSILYPQLGSSNGTVVVGGTLVLGGTLYASMLNGYTPNAGTRFQFLSWTNSSFRHGGFTQVVSTNNVGANIHLLGVADYSGLQFIVKSNFNNASWMPTNLVDEDVLASNTATFLISPLGQAPFSYQWASNGLYLPGQTNNTLVISNVQYADAADYCVTVIDANDASNAYCASLNVYSPETVSLQTGDQTVSAGSNVVLNVYPCCDGPLSFQWRRNGQNLDDATNPTYTINNAQPQNGGTYDVVCANPISSVDSTGMVVTVVSSPLPFADDFTNANYAFGTNFVGSGSNTLATLEPGEPLPAGKPGGHSMWLDWIAPINGAVTINTAGSSFDTLLAVYTGSTVSNLTAVAADDDSGGFLASQASFNAVAGTTYHIDVDGLAGATGNIVLSLSQSYLTVAPQILVQPLDVTVPAGSNAIFSVVATNTSGPLTYQWFYNGWIAINRATNSSLALVKVGITNLGPYSVEIANTNGQIVDSVNARLEIGPLSTAHTYAKLADLLNDDTASGVIRHAGSGSAFPSLSAGAFGSQSINNFDSYNSLSDPTSSGAVSGSSRFYELNAVASGLCEVDTSNSDFATTLNVFTGNSILSLVSVASDVTAFPGVTWSRVTFPATSGVNYIIEVGAANGDIGQNCNLNWMFGTPPTAINSTTVLFPKQGSNLVLNANTSGQPTPSYRWQLNGVDIPGATSATCTMNNIQFSKGGIYTVIVSNLMGVVTNTIATVYVQVPLALQILAPNQYRLSGTFTQAYLLQRATNLNSPIIWTPLSTNPSLSTMLIYTDNVPRSNAFYEFRSLPPP